MSDAAKIRAFEKMKDKINHVCSPQLTNSTTTVTNTSCAISTNVASSTSAKSFAESNDSDKLVPTTNNKNILLSPPSCSTITSLNSINTNIETNSGIPSHFQSTSSIGNGNDINMEYSNTPTPTSSASILDSSKTNSLSSQLQRDRDFRGQQSQPQTSLISNPMQRNVYRPSPLPIVDNMVNIFFLLNWINPKFK